MKFLQYINEEYAFRFNPRAGSTEVYKNPTPDDFKELFKDTDCLRFVVAGNQKTKYKTLYVVDSRVTIHYDLINAIPEKTVTVMGLISVPDALYSQRDYTKRKIIDVSMVNYTRGDIKYLGDKEERKEFLRWMKTKFHLEFF